VVSATGPHGRMNYLKAEIVMLFVMYCECWWPVCTGCCVSVCYVVQLSAHKHKHFCLQVTHKDIRSSLKMARGCQNM
jgi:hypothetical protein